MMTLETRSTADCAAVQLKEPVPLNSNGEFGGDNDRDDGHAELIWELQNSSYQSAGGVSGLQQIHSL